jgi:LAS superfamily LD-carboxypeptidase LdcB
MADKKSETKATQDPKEETKVATETKTEEKAPVIQTATQVPATKLKKVKIRRGVKPIELIFQRKKYNLTTEGTHMVPEAVAERLAQKGLLSPI